MQATQDIPSQLADIAEHRRFDDASQALVERWEKLGVGFEAVGSVLEFMEQHPNKDFGSPGALTHFIERFWRNGYEAELLASVSRHPTVHTVWLLNRLMNGEKEPSTKAMFVAAMNRIKDAPATDDAVRAMAGRFLNMLPL